jgi:hypothetical protein
MSLRIHAIVLALNEEVFITNQLNTLYPFCSGISVLTQYDRDWYGKRVVPDRTAELVMNHPDPDGKVHFVLRRSPDETAARNAEMLAIAARPDRGIMSHGNPKKRIREFYRESDYFFIVDADEFYDPATLPAILEYLERKRPNGMRVNGYNYIGNWNKRVPREVVRFCHFGFLRPGILFEMRRTVTWNESRLSKLFNTLHLPDVSARLWGFIECPLEIGVFHHGCWLGNADRLWKKASMSSHRESNRSTFVDDVNAYPFEFIPSTELPNNIRFGVWPEQWVLP